MRAISHARPSPSRTPERRRSTSPQTSFRERYAVCKSAEKRHQKTARPQQREGAGSERSVRFLGEDRHRFARDWLDRSAAFSG
ncbi:MAG: hypothetical protein CMM00_14955 [Rhodopirellula sp.]|nr:hypothetical protein [Rhodopirellula sp.]